MTKITSKKIKEMNYVDLMAFLEEINRPPGGKDSIRIIVQNCFITKDSNVLDIGCNTGYVSFEIARIAKCLITGIDINKNMIKVAKKIRKKDPLGHLIKFITANAINLPFKNDLFDVVISGGSTAFIQDKIKALQEYKRVLKPWGFIADINFFYRTKPPISLINRLNSILEIEIRSWDIDYWLNLYDQCDLEKYFIHVNHIKPVSRQEIKNYCSVMAKEKHLSKSIELGLTKILIQNMALFNENHKYLNYGIFILRKRPIKEQISLFGA